MVDPIPADVEALVRERRKIEAIRALRLRTGVGLKEAKNRIDLLERQLGIEHPSRTAKSALFWIVLILVASAIWWFGTSFRSR